MGTIIFTFAIEQVRILVAVAEHHFLAIRPGGIVLYIVACQAAASALQVNGILHCETHGSSLCAAALRLVAKCRRVGANVDSLLFMCWRTFI